MQVQCLANGFRTCCRIWLSSTFWSSRDHIRPFGTGAATAGCRPNCVCHWQGERQEAEEDREVSRGCCCIAV